MQFIKKNQMSIESQYGPVFHGAYNSVGKAHFQQLMKMRSTFLFIC